MLIYLSDICLGDPRISVDDSQEDLLRVDVMFWKNIFFEVLCAPTDIRGFSFLLMHFDMMMAVGHDFEVVSILLDKFFSLLYWSILMSLHGQENQVSILGFRMFGDLLKSLTQQLRVFLVARDDESMVERLFCADDFTLYGDNWFGFLIIHLSWFFEVQFQVEFSLFFADGFDSFAEGHDGLS